MRPMTSLFLFLLYLLVNKFLVAILPQRVRFYINSSLFYVLLAIVSLYGTVVGLVAWPFGLQSLTVWSTGRLFRALVFLAIGVKVHVEGAENLDHHHGVLVANHQTEADLFVFGSVIPKGCTITAKISLKRVPILGWWLTVNGTTFVDTKNKTSTVDSFRDVATKLKLSSNNIWVFAEGHRSNFLTPELMPFKKGAFHLAIQSDKPIIPIVASNYSNIISWTEHRFEAGNIFVKVLPPIETDRLQSRDCEELTQQTRSLMATELIELTRRDESEDGPLGS